MLASIRSCLVIKNGLDFFRPLIVTEWDGLPPEKEIISWPKRRIDVSSKKGVAEIGLYSGGAALFGSESYEHQLL